MDEQLEVVNIKKIGILSLAGTFAIISLFTGIILSIILALLMPVISSFLPLPIQLFLGGSIFIVILFFTIGNAVIIFVSLLIAGLFYNLASKITKGIKLYS